jgi:autotransporter-associated beta strand protein
MKKKIGIRIWIVAMAMMVGVLAVKADVISKANNTDTLNLGTSWVNSVAPGVNDVAQWDFNVTSGATYTLGSDISWKGMVITATCSNTFSFAAGNTLTLGESGITTVPDKGITFNNPVTLATNQMWSIGANTLIPAGGVNLNGYALSLSGGGTKQFKKAITGGGALVLNRGGTKFTSGTAATASDVFINNGASLTFDLTPAAGGAARAANITLRGAGNDSARATLTSAGVNNANTVDAITQALILDIGQAFVNLTPNAARPLLLTAGSFVRNPGNHTLFRGIDLGVSTLASMTAGDANVSFTNAPTMLGGGGLEDSKNVSILPGAYGNNTSSSGVGTALVTYDSIYGLRLLDTATEFSSSVTNLQTALDNVRIVNTSGSGIVTNTLLSDTTINSLSIDETGIGTNTGVSVVGDDPSRMLTLNSGTIFSRQIVTTATASDAVVISNLVLNLNGEEGNIISANQNTYNQGNTPAPLYIYASITNDNGKGVTIGAIGGYNGHVQFIGPTPHTYTGSTIVNSGILRLNKGAGFANIGVPGDLILNGGVILKNSESIPNTANLTLNGGSFYFDNTQSSGNNSHQETINNLYMNGGSISYNSGDNHVFAINGDAVVNASDLKLNNGGDVTVAGTTTLNGGRVLVSVSSSTSALNAFFSLNDVVITNLASGVYSPIILKANATLVGGQLALKGDLAFVGNSLNSNTALFDSDNIALAKQGVIALDGTRTFSIGNGAAAVDVQVNVAIADNGATVGGLIKSGAGTLALASTNAYTGATALSNGTLLVNGSIVSPVTVSSGAIFGGTGLVQVASGTALTIDAGGIVAPGVSGLGTLAVTGNVSLASTSVYQVELNGNSSDALVISGTVSGGAVLQVSKTGAGNGPWLILQANQITGTYTVQGEKLIAITKASGTELWLVKSQGTVISFQ